jgi:hypothetical protein
LFRQFSDNRDPAGLTSQDLASLRKIISEVR